MGIAYNTSVVRDGLVLHLDAANPKSYPGSGTTWFDLSGNGNNGILVNGVGYSSNNNGSLTFDGTNDRIDFNDILSGLTEFSAEFCFNASVNTINLEHWLGSQYQGLTGRLVFDIWTNNALRLFLSGSYITGSTTIQINTWYHAVFLKESNNNASIYLNGQLDAFGTISSVPVLNTSYQIGGSSVLSRWLTGNIAVNRLYNRALSESEIQQNFEALRGRYGI